MRPKAVRFPYVAIDSSLGEWERRPWLPIKLSMSQPTVSVVGLVDSGATVNVMPLNVGLKLGADWDQQTIPLELGGVFAGIEARAILVNGSVASFPPVELVFAWAQSNSVPLLLGQQNFFVKFDVCFRRSKGFFDVRPA